MYENFFKHNLGLKEYITGNRFIDICEQNRVTFCKTDNISEFHNTNQNVFVTHNSDYHIDHNRIKLAPQALKKWFAQNKDIDDNRVIGIPIGLENMTKRFTLASDLGRFSSQPKNGLQKSLYIEKVAKLHKEHSDLVYLNINPNTFLNERRYVLSLFQNREWVTHKSNISWKEYYDDIASHKFVFSPRGNGVDCHRTWEALYLRTIPIVKTSLCMNEFKDLPILFINKWEEIDYDFLKDKYEEMTSREYNLSKMKISYWRDVIKER